MCEIDLDAVQSRASMATRGPWHVEWDGTGYPQRVFNDAAVLVAETCTGPEWPPTDAEFIAHARTDVPALLARIAELEAERDDALDAWVDATARASQATARASHSEITFAA